MKSIDSELGAAGLPEILELRERVRALELRLDRMEQGVLAAPAPAQHPPPGPASAPVSEIDTENAAATVFTRVAMLCFVLLGALVLRVLTQQKILGTGFGTLLGLTYAAVLVGLSMMPGRFGGLARETSLFQCSGAVLAFVIAIESVLSSLTMSRASGMAVIIGFALLALGMGNRIGRPALAATGVVGGILALVALDLKAVTAALQLGGVILLAVGGLASSWRKGWEWMRPLTLSGLMLLLPAGFFFCGKDPAVSRGLLAAAAALWCALLIQHLAAFRRLNGAAAWLPVLTIWLAGIQWAAGWPGIAPANALIGALALAGVFVCGRRAAEAVPGLAGMMATAAVAGAIGWAWIDRTGLLCAAGAVALWWSGRRPAADWAAVFATALMLAAASVGLAQLRHSPVSGFGLAAMTVSAVLFLVHYVRHGRAGSQPCSGRAMRLAPAALVAGLLLLLGLFWELTHRLFDQTAHLLLAQTVLLVVTALALTFWGHAAHRHSPLYVGLACMVAALTKMLAIDLTHLKSFHMLASLIVVGLASVTVSVILRRRS